MTIQDFLLLAVATACFGCIIGAYTGTLDYRIRTDLPLITKDCYCPSCGHNLTGWEQFPILGWFLVKGRCRYCQATISIRYPLIEGSYLLFYLVTFLFLYTKPLLLGLVWLIVIFLFMTLRCQHHYRQLLKGCLILVGYHFIYLILLCILLASCGVLS